MEHAQGTLREYVVTVVYHSTKVTASKPFRSKFFITNSPDLGLVKTMADVIHLYVRNCKEIVTLTIETKASETAVINVRKEIAKKREKLLHSIKILYENATISCDWPRYRNDIRLELLLHEQSLLNIFRKADPTGQLPTGLLNCLPQFLGGTVAEFDHIWNTYMDNIPLANVKIDTCLIEHDELFLDMFAVVTTVTLTNEDVEESL